MKKWYFSDNGQVSGPFNINDAIKLLANNNDLYGWNPSFSQWLPVTQIPELSSLTSEVKPVTQISKELIEKFVSKKRDLNKKVKLIDEMIKKSKSNLSAFEQLIIKYNSLTESLSSDVKANILPIEKKKNLISKQLIELTRAADIAKHEIIDVVKEFGDLVLSKTSTGSDELSTLGELPELSKVEERKQFTSQSIIKTNDVSVSKTTIHNQVQPTPVSSPSIPNESIFLGDQQTHNQLDQSQLEPNQEHKATTSTTQDSSAVEHKSFHDVKSRLKSVFTSKTDENSLSLSEQLKRSSIPADDEVVFVDEENNNALLEEAEQKKKRRRRRRF